MHPGKRKLLAMARLVDDLIDQLERIQARVEHPFRVIKRQFGYVKVRYKGLLLSVKISDGLFPVIQGHPAVAPG